MKDTDAAEVRANNEDLPSRYLDDAKHQINSVKTFHGTSLTRECEG